MVCCGYRFSVLSNLAYCLTLAHIATVGKTHKLHLEQLGLYNVRSLSFLYYIYRWGHPPWRVGISMVSEFVCPTFDRAHLDWIFDGEGKPRQNKIILFFNRFRLAHDQIASWLPFGLNKSSMGFAPLFKLSCRFSNNNAGSYCSMVMMMDTLIKSSCHDLL
jgi:hypothetical protein